MINEFHNDMIFCVGIPNSGKTTLFNALTGLRQKVGNFHGITIEPTVGSMNSESNSLSIVDLPGTYSLEHFSEEEEVTTTLLKRSISNKQTSNVILFVCDSTNLDKGLYLFSQLTTFQIPIVFVVTMIDEVARSNGRFDDIELSHKLGCPVFCVVGHKGVGVSELKEYLFSTREFEIAPLINHSSIETRKQWSEDVSKEVLQFKNVKDVSVKIDNILLHPIWGFAVFLVVMFLFFQAIFTVAVPVMDSIESLFSLMSQFVKSSISIVWLRDLISDGLIAGVGSVLVFLPQIAILFFVITILEECGYLSRVAFMVDRIMGLFQLQGKSFIPLLSSHACAIPGIMSTRILTNSKDRLATILVSPLMTCSARLPVYVLLISVVIPSTISFIGIPLQGLVLAGLYFFAAFVGLLIAKLFKSTIFKGSIDSFLMELPPYRFPSMKNIGITVALRCMDFVKSAGSIILAFSLVLWLLMYFPQSAVNPQLSEIQNKQIQLEHSYAGSIGKAIQPVFAPLGFDWKITIGVIGSFAAREVFISTMGQIYSVSTEENDTNLRSELQKHISFSTGLSIIAFYIFALQCISTIVVIKKETQSNKWAIFAFSYLLLLAYVVSLFVKLIVT
jgi:ferrous iron transport protein B